jgi:hypothetical protein
MKKLLKKQTIDHFGKHYLLGADKNGTKHWLQFPSWDCDWYWGFGYIRTFTNNKNPEKSKDLQSHSHATDFMYGYFTKWNGTKPILEKRTFTEKEGWELSELFKQFYFLRDVAENFSRGKCHVSDTTIENWAKPELVEETNKVLIPMVMDRIIEILTPEKEQINLIL